MKLIFLVLLLAFAISPVQAQAKKKPSGLERVLRTMFPSAYPKIVPPKKKKSVAKPKPKSKYVTVGIEWMARYWEEEAAWDYYIPDDDLIRFKDGKYIVPIVVYRHYEDMVNTPRRSPTQYPAKS